MHTKLALSGIIACALAATATTTTAVAAGPAATGGGYACTHNPNSSVRIRANAGTNYRILGGVPNGRYVTVRGSKYGTDGNLWYRVSYGRITGWARYDYIC
ncbi:hypothetical protein B0181_02220 [Moraxella caviae]|uniref:Uncharacterized protein with a bacterial SH3 domain homologue n=1 Tax=Moraxella caviae TaxID=34060 RepID=A0A1T0A870_9GAMM|nr:SH3 domain-containing protein [Moraxella caviae]OOR91870.1 hypothetical protein B0181_02220 [Moraxella caviae]STZ09719.1 Uncharacterized protein with a bacterial SH3 domain homologue [Moraxella caviae]